MKNIGVVLFSVMITGICCAQTSIKLDDVSKHTGDSVSICGLVADLRYFENAKNQPTLLNIGEVYPNQKLTVVIYGDVRKAFATAVEDLNHKQICITGTITLFKERPQIIIAQPEQIKLQ